MFVTDCAFSRGVDGAVFKKKIQKDKFTLVKLKRDNILILSNFGKSFIYRLRVVLSPVFMYKTLSKVTSLLMLSPRSILSYGPCMTGVKPSNDWAGRCGTYFGDGDNVNFLSLPLVFLSICEIHIPLLPTFGSAFFQRRSAPQYSCSWGTKWAPRSLHHRKGIYHKCIMYYQW